MKRWKHCVLLMGMAVAASLPVTAVAGGWGSRNEDCTPGTRHARDEWGPAFCRSKSLERFSCAELSAYGESQRYALNTRYLANYQRPVIVGGSRVTTPATVLDPLLPTLELPGSTPPAAEPIR